MKPRVPSANPAYADAMELARTLHSRGIEVKCICLSKEERLFEGQEGAANYQTDVGVFEVLFLPKPETFNALEIVRARGNRRLSLLFSRHSTLTD